MKYANQINLGLVVLAIGIIIFAFSRTYWNQESPDLLQVDYSDLSNRVSQPTPTPTERIRQSVPASGRSVPAPENRPARQLSPQALEALIESTTQLEGTPTEQTQIAADEAAEDAEERPGTVGFTRPGQQRPQGQANPGRRPTRNQQQQRSVPAIGPVQRSAEGGDQPDPRSPSDPAASPQSPAPEPPGVENRRQSPPPPPNRSSVPN